MYPDEVAVNEKDIQKLLETYAEAYREIASEIKGATDFGSANRRAILSQIEEILGEFGEEGQKYIEREIPKYYESGAGDAVKQLRNVGAPLSVSEGFNRVHREAIAALVDDTAKAFGQSLLAVNRSAAFLLGKATRDLITQKIATGIIGGAALRQVKQNIVGVLEDEGIEALVDKGGKTWTLDRYSEMLFRTKAVEARNRGMINRVVENGYDLVQVSSHRTDHLECAVWEGKILSLTGKSKGFRTVAQAEDAGLFHPNCKHAINVVIPSLARKTQAYNPDTKKLRNPGDSFTVPLNEEIEAKIQQAHSYQDTFKQKMGTIADLLGFGFSVGQPKAVGRAAEKILNDYGGIIGELKDINRAVLFIDDPKKIEQVKKVIQKEFTVERVKSNFDSNPGSYKKAMINVSVPHGTAEIQITTKEYWEAKKELGGDALYKEVRIKVEGFEKLEKKMQTLYLDAEAKLRARLKVS